VSDRNWLLVGKVGNDVVSETYCDGDTQPGIHQEVVYTLYAPDGSVVDEFELVSRDVDAGLKLRDEFVAEMKSSMESEEARKARDGSGGKRGDC
jgi:hypothetical protein